MRFLIYSAIKMNFQDNSQSNSGVLIQWNYARTMTDSGKREEKL